MKNKYQILSKHNHFNWNDLQLSVGLSIITCLFLMLSSFMPLYAQWSGPEIDQQRTKVEEACIPNLSLILFKLMV